MPNHQCPNCAEELTPNPPWLACSACGRAYLEADLVRINQRHKRAQERQEILEILAEQNRRRSCKSSSNSAATKDDKLPTRKQRQLEWTEKDRERYLVAQTKIESKTEFLSVRGLPEDVTAEEVVEAIREELMQMKFRIMGTDIDGNTVTDEIEIPETDTTELYARAQLSALSAVQSDIRQRIADILKANPGISWFQHLAKEDFDSQIDRIEAFKKLKDFCSRKGVTLDANPEEHSISHAMDAAFHLIG